MCFSAGASFGAGVLMGSIGIASVKKASTPAQRLFAMMPVFFAIQQVAEGLTWLGLSAADGGTSLPWLPGAIYVFLFFAWMVWPVFMPFSLLKLEENEKQKKLLRSHLVIGVIVSIALSYVLIFRHVTAEVSNFHILYKSDIVHPLSWMSSLVYIIPTVFSCFVSSIKKMKILGIINLVSYVFTFIVFREHVTSVWCFFAAVSSAVVFNIISDLQKTPLLKNIYISD